MFYGTRYALSDEYQNASEKVIETAAANLTSIYNSHKPRDKIVPKTERTCQATEQCDFVLVKAKYGIQF